MHNANNNSEINGKMPPSLYLCQKRQKLIHVQKKVEVTMSMSNSLAPKCISLAVIRGETQQA